MPDSEAKKRWIKEHTSIFTVKLNHNTDKDLIAFMEGRPKQPTIKAALREYMQNHTNE